MCVYIYKKTNTHKIEHLFKIKYCLNAKSSKLLFECLFEKIKHKLLICLSKELDLLQFFIYLGECKNLKILLFKAYWKSCLKKQIKKIFRLKELI